MLALLLWQMQAQVTQQEDNQRQLSLDFSRQLASQLNLLMALKASLARTVLEAEAPKPLTGEAATRLVKRLRSVYPTLDSLVWVGPRGGALADTLTQAEDARYIAALYQRSGDEPFHYAFSANDKGRLYVLLHASGTAPAAYWLLRLDAQSLRQWLSEHYSGAQPWLLEDRFSQRVVSRPRNGEGVGAPSLSSVFAPLTAQDSAETIQVLPLQGSDWQLRALFNERKVRAQILPELAGEFLLVILSTVLTLLALYCLLREQRALHALNAASRHSLLQAASALGVIEECVLVTDTRGQLSYLNPQAEALFGLRNQNLQSWHLLQLLPRLDPLLLHTATLRGGGESDLVEIRQDGQPRLFDITRSDLGDTQRLGFVWVLRDVTEAQHATQVLKEARRRYQNIFEDTGIALCVLDLCSLHQYLQEQDIYDSRDLGQWLQTHPNGQDELVQRMVFTEANQMALRLLGVHDAEQVKRYLLRAGSLRSNGFRAQVLNALLEGNSQIELETRISNAHGQERHLWLVMRLPESAHDLRAVTLSLSDITSRKRIELSLTERERFWAEVVRAVPDTLYVHDISGQRVLFSNHHLGLQLGYSSTELKQMGNSFWEKLLHPDDSDYYWRIRNLQKVVGNGTLLESVLRWRHRNGEWRWFSIREQALSRDANGRVERLIGVAKDITEQIERSESLRDSEQRYRLLAESTSDVIFSTDPELRLNYVSPSVESALGYTPEWVLINGFAGMASNPAQLTGLYALLERIRHALGNPAQMRALREGLEPQLFVFDCMRGDDRKIPVDLRLIPMWDDIGRFEGLLGVGRDISQQRRAEKELRMAATVFEHSTAAILVTDPAGYIVQVNEAFSRVSGYSAAEVLDQRPGLLTADRQQATHLKFIVGQLNQSGSWEGEVWLKRRSGENFPAWVGITAVQDEEGDLVSYVCFFSDISERKASEQRIHRLAYYDALTHLPNRTLFQDRLHTALQLAERHHEWVVLMFLDLDRFKPINDSLGHAAGDRMLKDVAVRLAACVAEEDTVARMGGDEFTLLLQSRSTREAALTRAIHVAEQILSSLARPFILEGREFFVTASIGIALAPQDGNELSQLMKNADTAMYHAKERGKNNFQFYQADMNASALERLELESDLRHALEQGEFVLHYQPQFSGDGKRLTGVEALLRWQHPYRGLVSPEAFIPVLEELGLVVEVGHWVLREACQQLADWLEDGVRVPKISVNLSARQFAEGDLAERIASIIRQTRIDPAGLELELTESILMQDVASALNMLNGFKDLGLCLAIDDFGTGYSSLNYLKQFPIDVLKIDRSFVDGLPHGEQDGQIARAIIAMAHSLNLSVIAEGVETQAQLDFLREHGCDEVQGFLLGRPMPAHQFAAQFSGAALFMLS
ncbi:diguanylate cyclase [Pseudomonas sp. 21C1]|nr:MULTISPECIES: EAL domain-containing protein [Pseudomonas]OEC34086.1 diguanylate cyclase [Pseudomonas sp. 21C1]